MRILEHDGPTGIQLQYHPQNKDLPFCVVAPDSLSKYFWLDNIARAFGRFDKEVAKTKTPPTLDLDNPPKGLQTNTGNPARVLGKRIINAPEKLGEYVVAINHHGSSVGEAIYNVSRDGQKVWCAGDESKTTLLTLTTGPVKKEGWVNVYGPADKNRYGITHEGANAIFDSKQAAEDFAADREITATAKITWEE